MSATEIIDQLPKLTEAERRTLMNKLRELAVQEAASAVGGTVDLPKRGIGETQAADLRARLKTFTEDWNRPEAAIYDEDPAR